METIEFLLKMPGMINHPSHGIGYREIVEDKLKKKGVCYRHENNTSSFGTYGESWEEVYNELYPYLRDNDFLIKHEN